MASSLLNPGAWVTELMQALDESKLRMEDYASLVHKRSTHLLMVLVAEDPLSVNAIRRRASRFEGHIGKVGRFFGRYVIRFLCTEN